MIGLTLTQPWASLVALGAKTFETRDWAIRPVEWRGEIAIHAAQNLTPVGGLGGLDTLCGKPAFSTALWPQIGVSAGLYDVERLPRGAIVAVVRLADVGTACRGYDDAGRERPAVIWSDRKIEVVPEPELSFGNYAPGRRVWRLADIHALAAPVPCRGRQGPWHISNTALLAELRAQIGGGQ